MDIYIKSAKKTAIITRTLYQVCEEDSYHNKDIYIMSSKKTANITRTSISSLQRRLLPEHEHLFIAIQTDISIWISASLICRVVKASASSKEAPDSIPAFSVKNWNSSGDPARRLTLKGQSWDWLARVSIL